jgi:hypothetical protein
MLTRTVQLSTDSSTFVVGDSKAIGELAHQAKMKPGQVEAEIADLAIEPTSGKVLAIPTGADGVFAVSVGIAEEMIGQQPTASGKALSLETESGYVVVCSPEDIVEGTSSRMLRIECLGGVYDLGYTVQSTTMTIILRLKQRERPGATEGQSGVNNMEIEGTIPSTGARNMMIGFTILGAVLASVAYLIILAFLRITGSQVSLGPWFFWPLTGAVAALLASYLLAHSQREH